MRWKNLTESIATVLAVNTDLELFSLTTTFNTQFHKLADAFLVETCEGLLLRTSSS